MVDDYVDVLALVRLEMVSMVLMVQDRVIMVHVVLLVGVCSSPCYHTCA